MGKFTKFARLAEIEFGDIVISAQDLGFKLRIYLKDKSFIDFFFTEKLRRLRFAIHWERQHLDKTIYRIDNTPDKKWKKVSTFPIHFHDENYEKVIATPKAWRGKLSLEEKLRKFLQFACGKIKKTEKFGSKGKKIPK